MIETSCKAQARCSGLLRADLGWYDLPEGRENWLTDVCYPKGQDMVSDKIAEFRMGATLS